MFEEFIARLILYPNLISTFEKFLEVLKFRYEVVRDIIEEILESYRLFGKVEIDYLKNKLANREDVDLFMKKVASCEVKGDEEFSRWFIASFLKRMVQAEIKNSDNWDTIRKLVSLGDELDSIIEGNICGSKSWDLTKTINNRFENHKVLSNRKVLKTGIKKLDAQIEMAEGTVSVFMAPWKKYKSITLTNISASAVAQGLSVFHVHMEGRPEMWEKRFDSCLTGLVVDKLYNELNEHEKKKLIDVYEKLKSRGSTVYFMSGIPHRTTVNDIKREIKELKSKGLFFDVVIIDYMSLLRSVRGYRDDWKEQGELAWDLVRLAKEGYIVVSAVQSKREGAVKESLAQDDWSRSVLIPQAIDYGIAINQSSKDKERGIIRLSPLFARDREIFIRDIPLESCLWKMRISKDLDEWFDSLLND